MLWGGVLPLLIAAGALIEPAALLALAIYPLQILRIAVRRDWRAAASWRYAAFVMLAKFPELQGLLTFHACRRLGKGGALIEYKGAD